MRMWRRRIKIRVCDFSIIEDGPRNILHYMEHDVTSVNEDIEKCAGTDQKMIVILTKNLLLFILILRKKLIYLFIYYLFMQKMGFFDDFHKPIRMRKDY